MRLKIILATLVFSIVFTGFINDKQNSNNQKILSSTELLSEEVNINPYEHLDELIISGRKAVSEAQYVDAML